MFLKVKSKTVLVPCELLKTKSVERIIYYSVTLLP